MENCFLYCPFSVAATALFLFRLTKSRRTFYAQIECLCFHTASTLCGHSHQISAPANRFLEREAGDFNNPVDARSSGARSPDRARAHRRAGRLLVGSDLNAAREATGRISGFVMLYLAAGCLGVVE